MYIFILQGLIASLQWTVKPRYSADEAFSYLKLHFPAWMHVCILRVASPGCMTPATQTRERELCKQSCWLPCICLQMKRSWCCTCLGLFKPPKYNTSVAQTRLTTSFSWSQWKGLVMNNAWELLWTCSIPCSSWCPPLFPSWKQSLAIFVLWSTRILRMFKEQGGCPS